MLVGMAMLTSVAFGGTAQKSEWKPGVDVYPMWLHSDLTSLSGVNRAPEQKRFSAVWRVNGEFERASYGYIYGELDGHSRTSLDLLTKELFATVVNSMKDVSDEMRQDFDFTSFVPGAENNWKGIRARRISFRTNLDHKARHFEGLIMTDGKMRVWTFLVNYAADFAKGPAIAERLLGSIQIANRIEVGDAQDHYRAIAFPSGRIRRDVTGKYLTEPGG